MGQVGARHSIAWFSLGLLLVVFSVPAAYAEGKLRLKSGARGKLCVSCHDGFEEILSKRFVHTPLAEGECTGCHDPHTSNYAKLLAADPSDICYECHDEMLLPEAKSVHQVVLEGKCVECHDPHATENKNILVKAGSALCFKCHEELGQQIATNEFEHEPVTEDCLECHNPHASPDNTKLLEDEDPSLCRDCHETEKSVFRTKHENYPVEKGRCTSCHNPHGSNTKGILFDNVHDPVSDGECGECHVGATSSPPFALKDKGLEICEGCHYETVVEALNQERTHWPLVDKTGCVNCHSPHASGQEGLLKDSMLIVCGECHGDTISRQERSRSEHPPIAEGECGECHLPHGSGNLFLMTESSYLKLCEGCHEWEAHSTHPIGEKIVDPRNQNITVQCASCHRTHGTEYKHFIYFESTKEMCIQCHTEYRR